MAHFICTEFNATTKTFIVLTYRWWRVTRPKCGAYDWWCREGNLFQPIGHLATTISILQGFAFLCDLALLLFKPHGITKCKYERKNEKDSGRSSKMTSLCKWPIRSTTQIWVACEQQTHFRSSLLSLRKIASANPSSQTFCDVKPFVLMLAYQIKG